MPKKQATWHLWALLLLGAWLAAGQPGIDSLPTIGGGAPFKADKLTVLIVEETADRSALTDDQLFAMTASGPDSLQAAVQKRGGSLYVLDKDQTDLSRMPKPVQDAFALPRTGVPWIAAAGPKGSGSSQALPKKHAEIIAVEEAAK